MLTNGASVWDFYESENVICRYKIRDVLLIFSTPILCAIVSRLTSDLARLLIRTRPDLILALISLLSLFDLYRPYFVHSITSPQYSKGIVDATVIVIYFLICSVFILYGKDFCLDVELVKKSANYALFELSLLPYVYWWLFLSKFIILQRYIF